MKRWIFIILLFLILASGGAIVNIAVAWGFVLFESYPTSGELTTLDDVDLQWLSEFDEEPSRSLSQSKWYDRAIGWTREEIEVNDPLIEVIRSVHAEIIVDGAFEFPRLGRMWAGFPVRSLTCEYCYHSRNWAGRHPLQADLIESTGMIRYDRLPLSIGLRELPAQPIWSGFIINSVLYGLILLWMHRQLRPHYHRFLLHRWIRIKRGRCPKCGYDLRGTPSGGGCPECGWNREERSANST